METSRTAPTLTPSAPGRGKSQVEKQRGDDRVGQREQDGHEAGLPDTARTSRGLGALLTSAMAPSLSSTKRTAVSSVPAPTKSWAPVIDDLYLGVQLLHGDGHGYGRL